MGILARTGTGQCLFRCCRQRQLQQQVESLQHRGFASTRSVNRAPLLDTSTIRAKQKVGPFGLSSAAVFVATGIGLYFYFQKEKKNAIDRRRAMENRGVGTPRLGGPFKLTDMNGKTVTEQDFRGKFMLLYFGFTRCPDVCPEELDKMANIIEAVKRVGGDIMIPVFATCDPHRDSPETIKRYLQEFHSDIVGLTGPYEDVKAMCKSYRVYFSTPPNVDPEKDDYLVDHSLFMYLNDPNGTFIEVFGKNTPPQEAALRICDLASQWKGPKSW